MLNNRKSLAKFMEHIGTFGVKNMFKNILLMLLLIMGSNQAWAESKTTFYHYDLLGSPVATTDEQGNVLWREEYNPWGEKLLKQDTTKDNVRGYTGHVHDEETGLTYMQARYYDPQIGRFMGIDPVGFKRGNTISFNRYAYANNNSFGFTDPNGLSPAVAYSLGMEASAIARGSLAGTSVGGISLGLSTDSGRALSLSVTAAMSIMFDGGLFGTLNEAEENNDTLEDGKRKLGDLETIHAPDHPQNDPEIGKLTDDELETSINNPINGDRVTVKGNKVYDGNTRINEAKKRGFDPDMAIDVDSLPESSFDDNDPLGVYGDLE